MAFSQYYIRKSIDSLTVSLLSNSYNLKENSTQIGGSCIVFLLCVNTTKSRHYVVVDTLFLFLTGTAIH